MKTLLLAALALVLAAAWPAAAHVPQGDPEMPHADRADLVDRFGADEIDALAPVAEGASPRADAALADAGAEVDGALAPAFALPLPAGPWPALVAIEADLARLHLYDESPPKAVVARAKRARAALAALASGERWLVDGAGALAPRRSSASFEGARPVMTRGALRDL